MRLKMPVAEVTATSIKDAVLSTLGNALKAMGDDIRVDWEEYAQDIARDVAVYTQQAIVNNNVVAEQNLKHLKAQAELLAAKIAIREQARVTEAIVNVLTVSLQILGKAVFGALAV
jgi:hypothetical protein